MRTNDHTARVRIAPLVVAVTLALVGTACGGETAPVSLEKQVPAGVPETNPAKVKQLRAKAEKAANEAKARAEAEALASKNAGKGAEAPAPPPPEQAKESDPTAPGTYTYSVKGTASDGTKSEKIDRDVRFIVDKAYLAERGAQRQATKGGTGGFGESEMTFLWESNQVGLEKVSGQGFECKFTPPLKVRPVPLEIGLEWSAEGTCQDTTSTVDGKVLRKETITIGGESVECFVLSIQTETRGSFGPQSFTQRSNSTEWFSPKHRISVRQESRNEFSSGPQSGTSNITAVLKSLKPS